MKALPDKLSELILVALDDEDKAHRCPKYKVDMANWHLPNDVCHVCLAGAVMAFTHKASRDEVLNPGDYPFDDERKLSALNEIRSGHISAALNQMGKDKPSGFPSRARVKAYEDNRLQWRRDMRKISKRLSEAGL